MAQTPPRQTPSRQPPPRFSIGIDLGTTNSVLAFMPLDGAAESAVLQVPQWDTPASLVDAAILPSFLYLPEAATAAALQGTDPGPVRWVAGRLARRRAGEAPGRVVHSAKSWLCHHAADRSAAFLPWGTDELGAGDKISPIRASALILGHLRAAWDDRFGPSGQEFRFDAQDVTITVPASFDPAAQRLTLLAAQEAGFPDSVRLLEEPQAALYHWLEQPDAAAGLGQRLQDPGTEAHHVLVVDVGGGTSDFSLFALRPGPDGAAPAIARVAVSDHILLGGDNIDLALAHRVEPLLAEDGGRLAGAQWDDLVARCREVKERALAAPGPAEEDFPIALPGRGASLFAQACTARLSRGAIHEVLLGGFFPECRAEERPLRAAAGLKEWGLPYATDGAVTRHLVDFLRGRARVDAVLFNGGTLRPALLRERIAAEIGKWQGGPPPLVLDNAEPDLAVARGAARFGRLLHDRAERIAAGAARAVFIDAHGTAGTGAAGTPPGRALICVLPHGAAPGQVFEAADLGLELRLDRAVRFQTFASTRHEDCRAGDILDANQPDLQPLPPLETVARLARSRRGVARSSVPVTLAASATAVGLLRVECRSADPAIPQSWPLEFTLRPAERQASPPPAAVPPDPPGAGDPDGSGSSGAAPAALAVTQVTPAAVAEACARIETLFARRAGPKDKPTAARLIAGLEPVLGLPKGAWDGALLRALWPGLEAAVERRKSSVEHEEAWLNVAGFLLRPGFGAPLDPARIDLLWRLRQAGPCFPGKRIRLQEHILWRRLAGGLDRERQEALLAAELKTLRGSATPPPELVRLAGSLERIGLELKAELIERFLAAAEAARSARQDPAPCLAALGLLLNRTPFYGGPETVVAPDLVEAVWRSLSDWDWQAPVATELQTLFLRAARVVDDRRADLPARLRGRIADRLEKSGVTALRTARLRGFVPLEQSERAALYGEALPAGLILTGR